MPRLCIMAITTRHTFGWKMENLLKPYLEEALEDTLVKSANRFDSIDFTGETWIAELKSRPKMSNKGVLQDSNLYPTWYLPTCKEIVGDSSDKHLVFFYYWEADNTLWYIIYDKELFATFMRKPLFFHPTKQEHWYVPKTAFTELDLNIVL